jgi:hypothetical protein
MKYNKERSLNKKDISKGIRRVKSLIKKHIENEDYYSAFILQSTLLEDRLRVMYYLHCSIEKKPVDKVNNTTLGGLLYIIENQTSLLHIHGRNEKYHIKGISFFNGLRNAVVHQVISNIHSIELKDIISLDFHLTKIESIIRELKKEYNQ